MTCAYLDLDEHALRRELIARDRALSSMAQRGEAQRVHEHVEDQHDQLRAVLLNAPMYITQIGLDGRILYLNRPMPALIGQPWLDFVPEADRARVAGVLYRAQHGATEDYEIRTVSSLSGEAMLLSCRAAPGIGPHGLTDSVVVIATDITEARAREERLKEASAQLLQSQKLSSVGQLAAGIAHEINTPIQDVSDNAAFLQKSFARLLEITNALQSELSESGLPSERLAAIEAQLAAARLGYLRKQVPLALEQSIDGLRRVAGIVGAMKEFSHPSEGEKAPLDLKKAISTTATIARNEWRYVADLVIDIADDLAPVPGLRDELNQVVLNLIVNAAHAIEETRQGDGRGLITISAKDRGDRVELRIGDDGCGIPDAIRARIFEPFFTTKPVGKGTGQGLAIAYSVIVDKHGGTIDVESRTGKGTTFVITLPRAPLPKLAAAAEAMALPSEVRHAAAAGG